MAVNLLTILKTTNLPVAYQKFEEVQTPPYVIYRFTNTDNLAADNKVIHVFENFMIELYSKNRDTVSEGKIQAALDLNEIFWDRSETYVESEKLFLVTYEIQI